MSNKMATMQGCCCDEFETCDECFPEGSDGDVEIELDGIGTFTALSVGDCRWEYEGDPSCADPEVNVVFLPGGDPPPLDQAGWYIGIQDNVGHGGFPNIATSDYLAGPIATCEEFFDTPITMLPVASEICSWGPSVDVTLTYIPPP